MRTEIRCDSSSARQWSQRRGIGRLKHVDVRLCQLQDWVRENIISIGAVKTVFNVADLNTKKLTYARRAFLMYFLSQVEYSEGEEITHTGVDEYERYEQEKKLKEYVSSGPGKGPHQVDSSIQCDQTRDRSSLDQGGRFSAWKYRRHGRGKVFKERSCDAYHSVGACDSVHLDCSTESPQRVGKDQYDREGSNQ